ncbi:MAG: hypothetical protein H5U01_11710, partial [Clostridia bacterium]|nr:hypothetical protein [Clostridia bacterium]
MPILFGRLFAIMKSGQGLFHDPRRGMTAVGDEPKIELAAFQIHMGDCHLDEVPQAELIAFSPPDQGMGR